MPFGYDEVLWRSAKDEMTRVLIRCARDARPIPYSQLAEQVKSISFEAFNHAYHAMLGEISQSEDEAGRGMLSVLVVYKDGDMRPGPGFFELAKQLQRDTSDLDACWIDEYKRVTGYWRSHR